MPTKRTRYKSRQCDLARGRVSEPEVIRVPELDAMIEAGKTGLNYMTPREASILRFYFGKIAMRQIARVLGRNRNTVQIWAQKMRLGLAGIEKPDDTR